MSDVAIVVPWRGGDIHRIRSWTYTRQWWERFPWPMHVVEHEGSKPFNRSWCINEGARRAWPWNVLLVIDADVLEDDEQQVYQAVELAAEKGVMVAGHTQGKDLTQRATRKILQGEVFDWNRGVMKMRERCLSRVNAIPVELFTDLGGYDERYRGWGWEDSSFIRAHEVLYGGVLTVPGCSWHLWHPLSLSKAARTQDYQGGRALCNRYIEAVKGGPAAVRSILAERPRPWVAP